MEDIIPRELDSYDKVYTWRKMALYWLIAGSIGYSGLMLLFSFLFALIFESSRMYSYNWLEVAKNIFLVFGLPFGIGMALIGSPMMKRSLDSYTDALYANNPKSMSFPANFNKEEFSHRMVCTWMQTDNWGVKGNLYIGVDKLVFIGHKSGFFWTNRFIEINNPKGISVSLVNPQLNIINQWLYDSDLKYIEFQWLGGKAHFMVPNEQQTKEKLEKVLHS